MVNRAIAAASLACLSMWFAACSVSAHGELSRAQCDPNDNYDDDHDGLTDCADPDCWVYDVCLTAKMAAVGGKNSDGGAGTGGAGGTTPGNMLDAATMMSGDDSGVVSGGNGDSALPDPCIGVTCKTDEICTGNGVCTSGLFPANYDIRVSSAAVGTANMASVCFDLTCAAGISIPNFVCGCKPDPFLTVLVNGVVVGHSSQVDDNLNPSWPSTEPPIRVKIAAPTDVITFAVSDYDMGSNYAYQPDSVTFIFKCEPDLAGLGTGTLQCTAPWTSVSASPAPPDGKYRITANVARVVPQ